MDICLIIFVKNFQPGKVKTRLARSIGDANALEVYKRLVNHTRIVTSGVKIKKYIYYATKIDEDDEWDSSIYQKRIQQGDSIGERMSNAFAQVLPGHEGAIIIGSDCHELDEGILATAKDLLLLHDTVIGPAMDGGYYLLGMKKHHASIFEGIEWSTPTVLQDTLKKITCIGLSVGKLPVLADIDEFQDLKKASLWVELWHE